MKKRVLTMLMMVCLPLLAMAQSAGDDLYFIPKKKKAQKEEVKTVVPVKQQTTVYAAPGSTVVVKDAQGRRCDVDEYNRRYTSRNHRFSMQNDTLYINEKPLNERGEWVNGFEGSQADYEYAMRIVRFRNPRYAIPVSSPLYWDVVYTLPSWEWNVYDDGFYAYAFPTYSNRLWWDWRWNTHFGPYWGFSWGWSSPWYYNGWYDHYYYHHHYFPSYGCGGHWGGHHHHHHWTRPDWYDNRRGNPSGYRSYASHRGDRYTASTGLQHDRRAYRSSQRGNRNESGRVAGRVVRSDRVASRSTSVRPSRRSAYRGGSEDGTYQNGRRRPSSVYTRPSMSDRGESNYSRPSSTRSSVRNTQGRGTYRRGQAVDRSSNYNRSNRGTYNSSRNSYYNNRSNDRGRSSYGSGRSSGSSRSSYSSGGGGHSRSSYGSGGGRSSGGGSRRR